MNANVSRTMKPRFIRFKGLEMTDDPRSCIVIYQLHGSDQLAFVDSFYHDGRPSTYMLRVRAMNGDRLPDAMALTTKILGPSGAFPIDRLIGAVTR